MTATTPAERAEAHFAKMDAGQLREWTAENLAYGSARHLIGYAIDRLASIEGSLENVLSDLAADIEAQR